MNISDPFFKNFIRRTDNFLKPFSFGEPILIRKTAEKILKEF